jgi:hypothetical protein
MKLRGEVLQKVLSSLLGFALWDKAQVLSPQLHKANR